MQRKAAKRPKGSSSRAGTLKIKLPETCDASSMPTGAIVYDAYTSIKKKLK